jgi:hypothetical protein
MKNKQLWNEIENFSLDDDNSEYNFSIRLSHENDWPIYFTEKAILEYKKFMYLAAISDKMVSPSGIVDIVWHQHLIFTKSYSTLGDLLQKKIDHIPSTHNPKEKEKFKLAETFTKEIYQQEFGEQPAEIWDNAHINIYTGVGRVTLKSDSVLTFTLFFCFSFPVLYLFIGSFFRSIGNPDFLIG